MVFCSIGAFHHLRPGHTAHVAACRSEFQADSSREGQVMIDTRKRRGAQIAEQGSPRTDDVEVCGGRDRAAVHDAIRAAIRAIPAGEVVAYGLVARRAGLPGRARLVARVLADSGEHALPWHRVLRADGRIAFPPGSEGFVLQSSRLRAEGVDVDASGRVHVQSRPTTLDEAVWGGG